MIKNNPLLRKNKEHYLLAFLLGFGVLFVAIMPVIIAHGGYYLYYGDYNAQQIPFYNLANDAVRNGQFGWNWYTDLGSDFIGSYSFYLIGSPFFWLTTILPRSLVTLSMPFILCVKHGVATLTAYMYIRRFVRSKRMALTGGLLYAFSGFQMHNIFFNHFHDVTAFFPLLLITLEERVNNNRRGIFALTVAFMAVLNYFFFTGQVMFLIIYFTVRCGCSDFKINMRKFWGLVIEAIFGVMIAAVILVPSVLIITGNYRVSEYLYGQNMILYYDNTRIIRIIQAFFMPPDPCSNPTLFETEYGKWASIGGYLPVFSMAGVITFMKGKKKHWATRLVLICTVFAFIPVLNSSFYMFNSSYYARWFYMPVLIMAMMTAHALDSHETDWKGGLRTCWFVLGAFAVISTLPTKKDGKLKFFTFTSQLGNFGLVWLYILIASVGLVFASICLKRRWKGKKFKNTAVILTGIMSLVLSLTFLLFSTAFLRGNKLYIKSGIKGGESVAEKVSGDNFFRVDISEDYDNYPMLWNLPSMRAFQSVVDPSIMEFYPKVGVKRDVASRPDASHYTLRGLLSAKYYYEAISSIKENGNPLTEQLPGFEKIGGNAYFNIYENAEYIPMGFAYDEYLPMEKADKMTSDSMERCLIEYIVLDNRQIEKYGDIVTEYHDKQLTHFNKKTYVESCRNKRSQASSSFEFDSHSFTSHITLSKPSLVFFSVPYNKGWTAKVNGREVDVEKVSYGFMAVAVPAGDSVIEFEYRTRGLREGFFITLTGLAGLVCYVYATRRSKNDTSPHTHYYDYSSQFDIRKDYLL